MVDIPISHILFVSTALFFIGMYGLFTRRNMITMLMSIELILNSVNINFVVFNKYLYPDRIDGIFFTIFIITIAAAEAAVAIAIIINLYRNTCQYNYNRGVFMGGIRHQVSSNSQTAISTKFHRNPRQKHGGSSRC